MKKIPMDPKPPKNVTIKDSVREEAEAEKQQEAKPEKDKVDQVEITMVPGRDAGHYVCDSCLHNRLLGYYRR